MCLVVLTAVFEVSLKSNWDISDHMKMGEALAPLRDEGFLIITSGNTTHSPRSTRKNSDKFTEFMHDCMSNAAYTPGERAKKFHQACEQESFLENHPTMDHYLPMPVASAAASFAPGKLLWSGYLMGNLLASHFLFAWNSVLVLIEDWSSLMDFDVMWFFQWFFSNDVVATANY